jgi:AcrR family transcriptional regulator
VTPVASRAAVVAGPHVEGKPMMQTRRTKDAISDHALDLFLRQGYDTTSLEQIAEEVGITRPAVLYHFKTKETLLRTIIEPGHQAVSEVLDRWQPVPRPTAHQQEVVLRALLTPFLEHRKAIALITRFTNEYTGAGIGDVVFSLSRRCAALLGGTELGADPLLRVRVVATLAALSGILGARLDVPLETEDEQDALVHGLVALLNS